MSASWTQLQEQNIEDMFASLSGRTIFSKLNLARAYQQHDHNYTQSLYHVNRLPFGVASAPSMFQCIMENILPGPASTLTVSWCLARQWKSIYKQWDSACLAGANRAGASRPETLMGQVFLHDVISQIFGVTKFLLKVPQTRSKPCRVFQHWKMSPIWNLF